MKLATIPALSFALLLSAFAADNRPKDWDSVTFTVPRDEGAAAVKIEGERTLTKVLLKLGDETYEVPEEDLKGIDRPQLDTAQLLFGSDWYGPYVEGEEATPHVVIELYYGRESRYGGHDSVQFLFHGGKYQARMRSVRKTRTTWEEYTKPVGGRSKLVGTTTRPDPASQPPHVHAPGDHGTHDHGDHKHDGDRR